MVVLGSYAFVNHKGGAGKTTICFQCACQFAYDHPDISVIVFDWTELGDVTKKFGAYDPVLLSQMRGKLVEVLDSAEYGAVEIENQEPDGFFSRWFQKKEQQHVTSLKFPEKASRPSDFNSKIPENIWLVSSMTEDLDDEVIDDESLVFVGEKILEALEESEFKWMIFSDTDGDRKPSSYTKLAYRVSEKCIVPLLPDTGDFDRLVTMISTMSQLHSRGLLRCRIQTILWNNLQVVKLAQSSVGHFTPAKITQNVIQSLNRRLYQLSEEFPECFDIVTEVEDCVDGDGQKTARRSTVLVRKFNDSVMQISNACGIPFATMVAGSFVLNSLGFTSQIAQDRIDDSIHDVREILQVLRL